MPQKLVLALAVVAVIVVATVVVVPRLGGHDATTASAATGVLGECSATRVAQYAGIADEAATLIVGGSTLVYGEGAMDRIRARMDEAELVPDRTAFFVADSQTGEVFQGTCDAEKCTAEEATRPETACLRSGAASCVFVAVFFKNEMYCVALPAGGE